MGFSRFGVGDQNSKVEKKEQRLGGAEERERESLLGVRFCLKMMKVFL